MLDDGKIDLGTRFDDSITKRKTVRACCDAGSPSSRFRSTITGTGAADLATAGSGRSRLLHQEHRTCSFDFSSDFPVQICGHAGYPARQNLATFCHEFAQQIRILVIDRFKSDIDPATRHSAIGAAEIRPSFSVFRFHGLLNFAMQRVPAKERIILLFFESARSI
jgi:hypothetical protein